MKGQLEQRLVIGKNYFIERYGPSTYAGEGIAVKQQISFNPEMGYIFLKLISNKKKDKSPRILRIYVPRSKTSNEGIQVKLEYSFVNTDIITVEDDNWRKYLALLEGGRQK